MILIVFYLIFFQLEVIDACVFYIECLQRQLSDNEKENEKESNAIHKEDVG